MIKELRYFNGDVKETVTVGKNKVQAIYQVDDKYVIDLEDGHRIYVVSPFIEYVEDNNIKPSTEF